ncbi:hypothetical protein [uncultured Hoeflea sp.]|uniref:hypothetical protein n=1 Tax=uncultured Hoeflea sp. TaxID=538666 RepID=UPI0026044D9A|nr:hypothetical protein [uncultured Hoeflea sp.]
MRFPTFSIAILVILVVFLILQWFPYTGILLLLVGGPILSAVLINIFLIALFIEVVVRRLSRFWLLLPMVFYGGYWVATALDHLALHEIRSRYDAANDKVVTGFDPVRHALVFEGGGSAAWLTQNFALPVAYTVNPNFPERYLSKRMIEITVCRKVRESRAAREAFVHGFGFFDGDLIRGRRMEKRFCALSIPEKPTLPQVVVRRKETRDYEGTLPVRRLTTRITMPDGRQFELFGGVAAPLSWIPMPTIGCVLDSGAPSWNCGVGFGRDDFSPIVSGNTRFTRDTAVLAKALGLRPMAIGDRVGGDSKLILARVEEIERTAAKKDP